jgi:hypothetical protein
LVNFEPYRTRLPTRAEVEDWWRESPIAGLAVLLGAPSRLVAVQAEGAGGARKVLELNDNKPLPETPVILVPNGKVLLFSVPPGRASYSVTFPGVEDGTLRLLGEDVILPLPPSVFAGEQLEWEEGHAA